MKKLHTIILPLAVVMLLAGCQSPSQIQENQRIEAMQMVKHLALGCHLYAQDNDGMLPLEMSELKPYVEILFNPDEYDLVASGKLSEVVLPSRAILIRHKALLPGGLQAVAFADGHAEIISVK
jgi:hypothetical protein